MRKVKMTIKQFDNDYFQIKYKGWNIGVPSDMTIKEIIPFVKNWYKNNQKIQEILK